jgi:hypothetical protein
MILLTGYDSKKDLKANIGNFLAYQETSAFGPEYKANGTFTGAHRPALGVRKTGREFFAVVTMIDGKIAKIE